MSEYADIEQAIVDLLASLEESGSPLFSEVRGTALPDRRGREVALQRAITPAALVVVLGRARRSVSDVVPGAIRVLVAIGERNLRTGDGVRRGDVDALGAFLVAQRVCTALDGVVTGSWRLAANEEQLVAADDRHAVVEITISAERIDAPVNPTYGGDSLVGADSIVAMEVGERKGESITYGFPGIDGVFQDALGSTEQAIVWRGVLRAATHDALNAIEATLEDLVARGGTEELIDPFGVARGDCAVEGFTRRGTRRVHPTTSGVAQGFELRFVQLAVTA